MLIIAASRKTAFDEANARHFGIPLCEAIQWLEDGTYEVK